ncbi:alkylated DNA repair dioxygenase AlkB [Chitinophaga dinghuensis]|uniref:Alkylated DNA repair dioxygenase AlkB n=1 Tax=Chitinophaga dinghuensis TaxID=1539050 RepID=A0A327W075_9BACT|nr:alpha-ketoglutarate-dependent dioxygenase AlkB [Chitinophaga dinghuensis]RAJ80404.1 alkylated DNA repair dioxygenase AlkB [Chitinophaga dinghuensis]
MKEKHENILPVDGEIYLFPALFDDSTSAELFDLLMQNIQWKQEPVKIMGQEIMQPRLTAWYGDEGQSYSYTGITMHPLRWTKELLFIKKAVEDVSGECFNSALLNLYRDGNDSVGWHRDNEKSLGINPVIGSVSLGESREFSLKHYKEKKWRRKIMLDNGSLLLMKGETQHKWLHSIQKNTAITKPRINITFRTIKEV